MKPRSSGTRRGQVWLYDSLQGRLLQADVYLLENDLRDILGLLGEVVAPVALLCKLGKEVAVGVRPNGDC